MKVIKTNTYVLPTPVTIMTLPNRVNILGGRAELPIASTLLSSASGIFYLTCNSQIPNACRIQTMH